MARAALNTVFAEEMGTNHIIGCRVWIMTLDEHCQHLIVPRSASGQVVGCTRILTADAAEHAGGFYSETDLIWDWC
ncbi:MAG: GNAT family N-acetyltransferase [Candidatus Competibacteraceae bacterium]|nr:GNAT family N-acetyltransferase [Candidatus Competibacteraceae bacterium]